MTKDLLVVSVIATIVEGPDTTQMSARHPTKEEKILPKEEVEEKNHHQEKGGVKMIVMNEDPLGKEGEIIKELHKEKTSSSCW